MLVFSDLSQDFKNEYDYFCKHKGENGIAEMEQVCSRVFV